MRRREASKIERKLKQMNLIILQKYYKHIQGGDRKKGRTERQMDKTIGVIHEHKFDSTSLVVGRMG